MSKFNNYKFKIKEMLLEIKESEYQKIKVCIKKFDDEAYLYSINGGGEYSLYLQDRFFNFSIDNETKNVSAFEGDLNFNNLKFIKLKLPNKIKNIILSLDTNEELHTGCGSYIEFDIDNISYDKENKILQIGNINTEEITYRFFQNAYTQFDKNNITGLIFTEIEL